MRAVVSNPTIAVHTRQDEQPLQDLPVKAAVHRLADVKLEPPYRESDIAAFLQDHRVRKMGDGMFDDCLFQSVLFTDLFKKLETGEIKPGQPEHDRPVQYLLKKSVELLQPLGVKIEATRRQYDEMLPNSSPEQRAKLEKELKFEKHLFAGPKSVEAL